MLYMDSLTEPTSGRSYSGILCGINCGTAPKDVILLQYQVMIAEQHSEVRVSFKLTGLSPGIVWLWKYDAQCGITFFCMRVFLTIMSSTMLVLQLLA